MTVIYKEHRAARTRETFSSINPVNVGESGSKVAPATSFAGTPDGFFRARCWLAFSPFVSILVAARLPAGPFCRAGDLGERDARRISIIRIDRGCGRIYARGEARDSSGLRRNWF